MSMPTTLNVTDSESAYFDRYVKDRGEFNAFGPRGWQTLRTRFEEMVHPQGKLDILDVGCGTGQSRQIYAPYAKRYTGIDISQQALETARRKYPDDEWQVADACQTPFADQTFDAIAFSSVLHHIPEFTRALVEAKRLLRPGGHVFAFDPNLRHPAMFLFRNPKSPFYLTAGVSPNERPLWPVELRKAFETTGLVNIKLRCQANLPYRAVAPRFFNACLGFYNAGDWVMEKIGLGRLMGSFIVTAAQKPI